MDRLEFVKQNNIENIDFFTKNYDSIMTVYTICSVCGDYKLKNLVIQDDTVTFNLKKSKKIPVINSCTLYGIYLVNTNINNDSIEINIRVSV